MVESLGHSLDIDDGFKSVLFWRRWWWRACAFVLLFTRDYGLLLLFVSFITGWWSQIVEPLLSITRPERLGRKGHICDLETPISTKWVWLRFKEVKVCYLCVRFLGHRSVVSTFAFTSPILTGRLWFHEFLVRTSTQTFNQFLDTSILQFWFLG